MKRIVIGLLVLVVIMGCFTGCGGQKNIESDPIPTESVLPKKLEDDMLVAPARKDGLWGYIDTKGEWVIEPQFDYADGFSEGLAYVQKDGLGGFIDSSASIVLEVGAVSGLDSFQPFQEGFALGLYSEGDKFPGVQYQFIDTEGNHLFEAFAGADSFQNGLAPVSRQIDAKGYPINYGFIDMAGNFVIEEQYLKASSFSEGVACVQDKNGLYGFINKSGEWVIPPQYKSASSFHEGYALVQQNQDWYYIDKQGNSVFKDRYFRQFTPPMGSDFSDGLACVKETNENTIKYIDIMGNTVFTLPSEYDYDTISYFPFTNGYAPVQGETKDGKDITLIFDTKGNIVATLNNTIIRRPSGFTFVNVPKEVSAISPSTIPSTTVEQAQSDDGITWVRDITKVTKENVQKIKKGMNIQEAIQILGQPTQVLNGSPYLTYYWDAGSNGVQISNFDLGNAAIIADTNGTIISIESTGLRSEDEGFDSAGRQTIVVPDNVSNDDTEANNDNNYSIYTMILPEASTYSYSANEIMDCIAPWVESGYSISEALRLARNEVFACHGNIFEDAALNQYFYWERSDIFGYEGYQDSESAYAEFNDYELDNIATIKELEKEYK